MKTVYDRRWFIIGWSLGAVAITALAAAFYPSFKDTIGDLFASLPPALEPIVGSVNDYRTYSGYVGAAVFGVRAEIIFTALAVILGLALSVNEELSRRMYQLIAQPISRAAIVWQKWLAGALIIVVIMAMVWVGMVVTTALIGETVPYEALARILLVSALFSFACFSLTFGIGMAWGHRTFAMMIPIGWVILSLLVDSFAAQINWIKDIEWSSILYYYNTSALANSGIEWYVVTALGGVSVVSLIAAVLLFPARDIKEAE